MKRRAVFLLAAIHLTAVLCAPSATESWVTVSTEKQTLPPDTVKSGDVQKTPKIYSMRVDTNVTNRFAKSLVTSKVKNLDSNPQEATFSVVLPDTAFITGFVMEIDGKKYEAYIQEKEQAKKTYDEAVSSGLAAGHVAVNARDSNKFTVSVNIMPESKATFYLTYEELLSLQKGLYDIVINLHPGQPVKDMEVQVNINETRPLTSVTTPSLRSGNEITKSNEILDPKAEIVRIEKNAAKVVFKPDIEQQKEFAKELGTDENNGFAGQFIVQYDVERDSEGGELLFADGYFVHFFAPKDAKPEPKYITFVLDTSGSMWGTRIAQLKDAMKSILDQLKPEDSFNIIDFNSVVNVWNVLKKEVQYREGESYRFGPFMDDGKVPSKEQVLPSSNEISEKSIEKAKEIVDSLRPSGGTNIDSALATALKLHKKNKEQDTRQPIIMFLTDGDATVGETDPNKIVTKVSEENTNQIPIISISFGEGADRKLLEKLSLRNHGIARHIYEGSDAALQLKSFYEHISSPLFNKIDFKYVSENVTEVTKTKFPILFKGSELVVAGKYTTPPLDPGFAPDVMQMRVPPVVNCYAGPVFKEFKPTPAKPMGSLEKHWAYLTLKQILKERDATDKKDDLTKKALDLALKYSFVTPVSSLVVVKPNDTKSETGLQDASKGSSPQDYLPAIPYRGQSASASFYAPMMGQSGISNRVLFSRPMPASFDYADNFASMPHPPFHLSTPAWMFTTEKLSPPENPTISKLKMELPWFDAVYHAGNGSISLPQGSFLVGDSNDSIVPHPECSKTPLNGTGHCILLKDCPAVYSLLPTTESYLQYFCPLVNFAGVCCPQDPIKV